MVFGTLNEIPFRIEWIIKRFFSFSIYYSNTSPPFTFAGASWELSMDIDHYDWDRNNRQVHLRLVRTTPGLPINLEYSFSLRTRDGKKHGETQTREVFDGERMGYPIHFMLDSRKESKLVPDGILTVVCSLKCVTSTASAATNGNSVAGYAGAEDRGSSEEETKSQDEMNSGDEGSSDKRSFASEAKNKDCTCRSPSLLHKNKVLHDLKELFVRKEDCDVIIKVKGEEFPAHKAILMARSSVFASTFRSDMKEKASGIVDIEDCDPSSFPDFLCYLYCGGVENLSEKNVFSLFDAADKYDVQDLRAECLEFMKENLSVDTFCDTITLALQHCETELINLTTDFFIKNAPKIIVTVKWQIFLAQNPTQSNELFIKLLVPDKKV